MKETRYHAQIKQRNNVYIEHVVLLTVTEHAEDLINKLKKCVYRVSQEERTFGRVFLRSNYTDITQNTYIQSSMVTEILAREV